MPTGLCNNKTVEQQLEEIQKSLNDIKLAADKDLTELTGLIDKYRRAFVNILVNMTCQSETCCMAHATPCKRIIEKTLEDTKF